MIPALDGNENPGAAADVRAHVRLAPGASAIAEVFPVHMDAIEGIGGGAQAYSFNVIHGQFAGLQGLMGGLPG